MGNIVIFLIFQILLKITNQEGIDISLGVNDIKAEILLLHGDDSLEIIEGYDIKEVKFT